MDLMLKRQAIVAQVSAFVARITGHRWDIAPSQTVDALQQEIHQIEQSLNDVATRPSQVVRKPQALTPLTEQQKIIDLAG